MWPGRGHVRDPEYVFQEQKKGIKPMEANNENPIIQLVGLGKQFQTMNGPVTALEDINLEIRYGEVFGIIGLSGAGKSTLVRCINYLEVPTSGKVVFEGKNLSVMKDREKRLARQSMGMIFQQFNLLSQRNVLQNVCFPLEIAGVAIARAMATNPKVLLCDEATSALDPNTTKSILELLKKINREMGSTVIVITHEMAVIEAICDRVAIIDHSHIAEVGNVSDIFSGPKSDIGRQLILGDVAEQNLSFGNSRQIRIIFDGRESSEPVIANMVLACKVPVNIMHADTRDIEGKAMGQMIIQLPEDDTDAGRICNYLKTANVKFEEVR